MFYSIPEQTLLCFAFFAKAKQKHSNAKQIEATRRVITRYTKRGGKLWIMVFPDKPITARAEESRMGSGKGAVDYWVAVVKPGTILFELAGVPLPLAQTAMRLAAYKLPVKTKFITK